MLTVNLWLTASCFLSRDHFTLFWADFSWAVWLMNVAIPFVSPKYYLHMQSHQNYCFLETCLFRGIISDIGSVREKKKKVPTKLGIISEQTVPSSLPSYLAGLAPNPASGWALDSAPSNTAATLTNNHDKEDKLPLPLLSFDWQFLFCSSGWTMNLASSVLLHREGLLCQYEGLTSDDGAVG